MISTVDQTRTPLLAALLQAAQESHIRFYTPGHKGGRGASARLLSGLGAQLLELDIPEIPALDNLFAPQSVIQEAQVLAAKAFGAEQTWFLVNGSSCGLIASILATCGPGDSIILPRTVHQSVIHGLVLSGALPIWITPEHDSVQDVFLCITPQQVASALERYPQAKAVVAVSPSYEGVCGDIAALAAIAHTHHIPLIVDEAHGAHFGFHPDLPPSALSQGADLVVQSTHKVLSALTQSSMLHCQGTRIARGRLQAALRMTQSSSPNFLLLASLDAARQQMAVYGKAMLTESIAIAQYARQHLSSMSNLGLLARAEVRPSLGFRHLDPLRLTLLLQGTGLNGFAVDDWLLASKGIIAEFPSEQCITFILGAGTTRSDIDGLVAAMVSQSLLNNPSKTSRDLVATHSEWNASTCAEITETYPALSQSTYSPQQAFHGEAISIDADKAAGQVSQQLVCPYPPGIPILFPGEVITQTALDHLFLLQRQGGQVIGGVDSGMTQLWVLPQL